ncbi:uncharacterized protein LOC118165852 [Oxyura jamaicensis]|uniref:uncharacterized protein LOC118165852 n=1 Tax=Oxyura jamaicensis TaxID=8884 RepID=UPI0015A6382A|nr:uncharacterized protein LOC118165852 [Oxyura jamaicensis]
MANTDTKRTFQDPIPLLQRLQQLNVPQTSTKPKPAAKPRLQHPGGAPQLALPSAIPRPSPRDKKTETAVKAAGHRQPSKRLSTAIPTVASRSRLRPPGKVPSPKRSHLGSTTQELLCNRTRELKENGQADQTWVCVGSPSPIVLPPVPAPGCGEAAPAEQPAGDRLSQELKRVKDELERVKGELADRTARCEAYRQTISSLQAQLRAAGIWPEDAAVDENGVVGRD